MQNAGARLQHNADGTYSERPDQAEADKLLGNYVGTRQTFKGNFVWDLPDIPTTGNSGLKIAGLVLNDWQLSGVWTANTGTAYNVGISYASGGNVNVTGSPNFGGRVRITGPIGAGCSSDPYRQLTYSGFAAPEIGSVGLESGQDYLRGCFSSAFDLAIARNIRLGGHRAVQLRVDMFNAPNQAIITGRNATMQVTSPTNGTQVNLPFDASGNLITSRSLPKNAGFGVASGYQAPRTVQVQVRFQF
jgi:hypothetical protein